MLLLWLRQGLSLFLRGDFINCNRGSWLSPLADRKITTGWRESDVVDLVSLRGARNEGLEDVFKVVDYYIMARHVDQLLLFVDLQAVVKLASRAKDKLWRNGDRLHAKVG